MSVYSVISFYRAACNADAV